MRLPKERPPSVVRHTAEQVTDNCLPSDFLERVVQRDAWQAAGLCRICGERPSGKGFVVCEQCGPMDRLPTRVADLLPDHERELRRKARHLAFVVRDLLAACGDRNPPSDRALASVGCALAAYELAADECGLLRAMGEENDDSEDLFPDGNIEGAAP